MKIIEFCPEKKQFALLFQEATAEQVAQYMENSLAGLGYRLSSGTPVDGVYATGSFVLRLFLGGFVKYNAFKVQILQDERGLWAVVSCNMSGWLGGALGASAYKKAYTALCDAFQQVYESQTL